MTIPIARRQIMIGAMLLPLAPVWAETALQLRLAGLARFVGRWKGERDGDPGHSRVERTYEVTLDGKFLKGHNISTYAPQPKNPKGEVHHNIDYIGFDKARKRAVFRQFHTEGFVAQYVATSEALDGPEIVFESESIENIPEGFKARETYRFSGARAFEEVFELAEPGKPYAVYSHNRFKRV